MKVLFCYKANFAGGVVGYAEGHCIRTVKRLTVDAVCTAARELMVELKRDNPTREFETETVVLTSVCRLDD